MDAVKTSLGVGRYPIINNNAGPYYLCNDKTKTQLDRGSIRSSPSNGLSTPCRLTIRNSARLFHHVLFNMGDLHLVLPALNLSTLNAVLTEHGGLLHALPLAVHLRFLLAGQVGETTLNLSYSLRFIVGPLLHA